MGRRPRYPQADGTGALTGDRKPPRKTATRLVEGGRRPEWTGAVVNPPVWRGSTHLYDTHEELARGHPNADGHFHYGRRGAPTQWALAEALTELEPGAAGTMLYPSGTAALFSALAAVLESGDRLALTDNAYEPTRAIAFGPLKRMGVETITFDPLDHAAFEALVSEGVAAVLLESPGSLTMEVCDVPALADIAHRHGATVLLDNTWASPLGFAALDHGADIAIMSLTKHVGGHSDLLMGSAAGNEKFYRTLRRAAQLQGQHVSPDDAALAHRGLRTMQLRLERATENARKVAEWLAGRDEVAQVLCPLLPGAPGNELWQRDFSGGCGLFSFVLKGRDKAARGRFLDALDLFGMGYSWGGYESLAVPFDPARIRDRMAWPPAGCANEDVLGIRLSVGLEDSRDLIADLEQGIAALHA
ncbi:cystathionine beta-lyase [Blastomonas marina]|uniref:Cystathionine beta-lyase n=1 Tax=Blastomonas marina TaxID=1867408 RepID=A0ABQ1FDM9_9SPHN|nr:cystathionine beta-lyase [Blastomonas marina]GGA08125.1 cystathionine beta-lyase [Blastomonas marina]